MAVVSQYDTNEISKSFVRCTYSIRNIYIYITFERVNYKTHYTIHVVTRTITTLICNFIDIIATCCRVSLRCQRNAQNVSYNARTYHRERYAIVASIAIESSRAVT